MSDQIKRPGIIQRSQFWDLVQQTRAFESKHRLRFFRAYFSWLSSQVTYRAPSLPEKFTVILLSFRRYRNISAIVDAVLASNIASEIIVSNNNKDIRIKSWVKSKDPIVKCLDQTEDYGPIIRYFLASQTSSDYFMSIDDDLFLFPHQIYELARGLLTEPQVIHGVWGQDIVRIPSLEPLTEEQAIAKGWIYQIEQRDCRVDIMNRAYAFCRSHAKKTISIYDDLVRQHPEQKQKYSHLSDDIFMSLSGEGKPICHNLGALLNCPSSNLPTKAISGSEIFHSFRHDLYCRLTTSSESLKLTRDFAKYFLKFSA